MDGNLSCSSCQQDSAEVFCICTDLPLFCGICWGNHKEKDGFHFPLSTDVYCQHFRENQRQHIIWLQALTNSQEKLKENLLRIDQLKAEIEVIQRELSKRIATLAEIKRVLSAEIDKAIAETTSNVYKPDYTPQTYLAYLILSHWFSQTNAAIPVFECEINSDAVLSDGLGFHFSSEVPELEVLSRRFGGGDYEEIRGRVSSMEDETKDSEDSPSDSLPTPQLVHIDTSAIRFFDFESRAWKEPIELEVGISTDQFSRWVVLAGGSVFCCGGYETPKVVYVIDSDGSVERKTDMKTERADHGVLALHSTVYVFGGCKC